MLTPKSYLGLVHISLIAEKQDWFSFHLSFDFETSHHEIDMGTSLIDPHPKTNLRMVEEVCENRGTFLKSLLVT